jgi:hypothetical protein
MLLEHLTVSDWAWAFLMAGNASAAKTATMEMTTSNSIRVNPLLRR